MIRLNHVANCIVFMPTQGNNVQEYDVKYKVICYRDNTLPNSGYSTYVVDPGTATS